MPDRPTQHLAYLTSLGLSDSDWRRIKHLASEVTKDFRPAALDDLSVPIRVGACLKEDAKFLNGTVIGAWKGRALLMWEMTSREREDWARKRPAGR